MFTARRCFWFNINPAGAQRRRRTWLRGFYAAMAQWNQGAYVNYADPDLEDYLHDHFGANLEGLSAVKRAYDPHNFFRFPQSIPPA